MLEGAFVDNIMMHSETRAYPVEPQYTAGLTDGTQSFYKYSLRESSYPTLTLVDEIANETGSVNAMINSKLISRKQACKMINEMFGLNIDVKVRDEDVKIHDTDTVDM